jgi:hypothetical protein
MPARDSERKGEEETMSWKSTLMTVAVVMMAATAAAQVHGPGIGVYFDEAATMNYATLPGGMGQTHTAYVYAVDSEMFVQGASFKLNLDPRIHVQAAQYPNALKIGEPEDGVDIGFTNCRLGFGQPVLCCILTLWTGNDLMNNAEIKVVAHPSWGGIFLSNCEAVLYPVSGYNSYLTIAVPNDEVTWGSVKDMYR